MSEQMSLDTRERDTGGNYIADHDTYPQTVWFANGRRVSIDHTEVKNEIEGGRAYLQIDRNLHPAFRGQPPVGDVEGFKYLNAECGLSGCQWLTAQHQVDVYRKQMAEAESACEANKNAATYWWTRYYRDTKQERPRAFDSATEEFAASHISLLQERDSLRQSLQAVDKEWQSLKEAVKAAGFRAATIGGQMTLLPVGVQ